MWRRVIRPLSLTDSSEIKVLGFADDSNLLVLDMQSLVHIIDIVRDFENATGSKLNRHKTKIFGAGSWKGRNQWPLNWLQTGPPHLYTF